MKIAFDETKRRVTLDRRGLDFQDALKVFAGTTRTLVDDRIDYGEERFVTYGHLNGRAVVMVHVSRGDTVRVISMRHAHKEEIERAGLE